MKCNGGIEDISFLVGRGKIGRLGVLYPFSRRGDGV